MKNQTKQKQTKKKPLNLSSVVYDLKGKKTGEIELDKKLFNGKINAPLMHQSILMYQANKRAGTVSTKTRRFVRGGGKKPWRQKGTGRARVGSSRNPVWRGGGVAFGPHPRNYSFKMSNTMKNQALISGLNTKLIENELQVINEIALEQPKTKLFKAILDSLKIKGKVLVVLGKVDKNIKMASRNIPNVSVKTAMDFNVSDVLRHKKLLISEPALKSLHKRLA